MTSPFLTDLNDFISPSQACIKPVQPAKKKEAESDELSVLLDTEPVSDPVTISLNDCLACSGCITSAESVLVNQQTFLQLKQVLYLKIEALLAGKSAPQLIVVSVSPQTTAAIASRYGLSASEAFMAISSYFKSIGVDFVFDTVLARDISLFECGQEFLDFYHQRSDAESTLICGACPGWVCYAEKTQQHLVTQLSRTKSPQQIMGVLVKHFFSQKMLGKAAVSPAHIYHVTVMPCFDKKLEASRPDFFDEIHQTRDVDCVIASSELVQMIEEAPETRSKFFVEGLDFDETLVDHQLSLFRASHHGSGSGGYLEHVFRIASKALFNVDLIWNEAGELILSPLCADSHVFSIQTNRNEDYQDYVLSELDSQKVLLRFAKVYGFRNVQTLVRKLKGKRAAYDYVEVMACPGACLNGGGQPRPPPESPMTPTQNLQNMKSIYAQVNQKSEPLTSPQVEQIYREWLGGHASPLLRTSFRAVEKTLPTSNFSVQW
jgi:iron only hydrogenase large subunit-like protein